MCVVGCDVELKKCHGVARQGVLMEDHSVPSKKPVGLVARQEELEETLRRVYTTAFCHLSRAMECNVVWES